MDEKEYKFNLDKRCRVCLQTDFEMCEIFGVGNEYVTLLRECGRVDVEEHDGLPTVICENCVKEMMQAQHFAMKCQNADKKLRQALLTQHMQDQDNKQEDDLDENIISFLDIKNEIDTYETDTEVLMDDGIDENEVKEENVDGIQELNIAKYKHYKNVMSKKKKRKKSSKFEKFPTNCKYCGIRVSCKSALLIHTRTHTNERPFQCNDCEQSFKAKGTLEIHQRRCHMKDYQKTHQCIDCKKFFFCGTELRVHMRSHTGDTPYKCKLCNKAYTQSASLKRHVRSCHTGERPYHCSKCAKSFVTLQEMRKHEEIHTEERKFVCNICSKAFKCKPTLRIHLGTHSRVKKFICDQCGNTFSSTSNLITHKSRIHSKSSGQCSVCGKTFTNLEDHIRVHTGETPFHCKICGKKFSLKSSYVIHFQIHESAKYPCQYKDCTKSFPKPNFLEFHVLKHHKKFTPYTCEYCDKGYFRFCDIKIHMKMNHSDKDITNLKKIKIPPSFFSDTPT